MHGSEKIAVVIANWNAGSLLRDCIDSVTAFGGDFVNSIVVVDNGSTDGSERTVEGVEKVKLIRAGENLGFGKACNLGARHVSSEYLLFLNPDAALYPDALAKVLAFMQDPANARVGICGVQLRDETGHIARSCARFPSVGRFFAHALGVDRILPRLGHFMLDWDHSETRAVDQVIGAFFLVRRSAFDELGGFDERFFVYFEEVDFSYRAHRGGWSSVYLAAAQAFHAGGGTSRQVKARRLFYSLRSRLIYSFKHFSMLGASLVMAVTLLIEPLTRMVLALAKGSVSGFKETLSAYGMLFGWLPKWWFKGEVR